MPCALCLSQPDPPARWALWNDESNRWDPVSAANAPGIWSGGHEYSGCPAQPCSCGHRRDHHTDRDVSDVVGWPCLDCRSERCRGFAPNLCGLAGCVIDIPHAHPVP